MINVKAIYNELLNNPSILELVDDNSIFDGYPTTIEQFPCICFVEDGQTDTEYADNRHTFENCAVQVHIYTKALDGYPTTSEIGVRVADVFNENYWHCRDTKEVSDPNDDVKHRVMNFSKQIYLEEIGD